jgi:FkbM family methyltransferase
MLKKIKKLFNLIQVNKKYPNVRYYGAPSIFQYLGFNVLPMRGGFYSQYGQDELIFTEFFKGLTLDSFPRIFIDIGCNHPLTHSNSCFYEKNQNYKVIAVDPLSGVHELWSSLRPGAFFFECAVGAVTGEIDFDVVEGCGNESMFSSVSGVSGKVSLSRVKKRKVAVRRMSDILSECCITRAGIVSMDIEGYELNALRGVDFARFSAYVFVVENNGNQGVGDNKIRDFMIGNGYVYFARIWGIDDVFVHPDLIRLCEST